MPQTTPDVLAAAIKCFHLNAGLLPHQYVVIYSPYYRLFAVTTLSTQRLREASGAAQDWCLAINLPSLPLLQLLGVAPPDDNDLIASALPKVAPSPTTPAPPESGGSSDASSS